MSAEFPKYHVARGAIEVYAARLDDTASNVARLASLLEPVQTGKTAITLAKRDWTELQTAILEYRAATAAYLRARRVTSDDKP